jgi:hypothetical protein
MSTVRRLSPLGLLALTVTLGLIAAQPARAAQTADPALNAAINNAWTFADTRLNAEIADVRTQWPTTWATEFPRNTYTSGSLVNHWQTRQYYDWQSGFYIGALWLTYQKSGDAALMQAATNW